MSGNCIHSQTSPNQPISRQISFQPTSLRESRAGRAVHWLCKAFFYPAIMYLVLSRLLSCSFPLPVQDVTQWGKSQCPLGEFQRLSSVTPQQGCAMRRREEMWWALMLTGRDSLRLLFPRMVILSSCSFFVSCSSPGTASLASLKMSLNQKGLNYLSARV